MNFNTCCLISEMKEETNACVCPNVEFSYLYHYFMLHICHFIAPDFLIFFAFFLLLPWKILSQRWLWKLFNVTQLKMIEKNQKPQIILILNSWIVLFSLYNIQSLKKGEHNDSTYTIHIQYNIFLIWYVNSNMRDKKTKNQTTTLF